ncbi:MAG TPA: DNA repair protein RadC [Steroidobacteraceae bacterium]
MGRQALPVGEDGRKILDEVPHVAAESDLPLRFELGGDRVPAGDHGLVLRFGALEHEVFSVIYLDSRHRVIECRDLFRGTIDAASVHPREVVKEALGRNAAACILAHNHPSGVAEPSAADELITRKIREALGLVDIRVLDHVVVAAGGTVSFAERGLL